VASETTIANAALVLLGERRISSINESHKTAKTLLERFPDVRDDVLRAHPWNFASVRVGLAKDAAAPVFQFDNAYTLPNNCLRLLEVDENKGVYRYTVEGRKILTDQGAPLNILYTAQITDVSLMDVMFRNAMAAALAADVAEVFTGSTTKQEQMLAIMVDRIRLARVPDGQEPAPREIEASEWLDAREETGFVRGVPTGPGTPL
jgi:hypothetical protein